MRPDAAAGHDSDLGVRRETKSSVTRMSICISMSFLSSPAGPREIYREGRHKVLRRTPKSLSSRRKLRSALPPDNNFNIDLGQGNLRTH